VDAGWVAAVASIASAVIVAITAIAAFRQLRHYRNANDIVVYLRLIDQMDSEMMVNARSSVAAVSQKYNTEPEYRRRLRDPTFTPEEFRPIGMMLRFLEHISVLVTKGGIAESLILAEYADIFVVMWDQLHPAIIERRVAFGPYTGRAFEHLAMRARRYIDSGEMEREYALLERDPRTMTS
jgi:hypothetical protein